MLPQTNFYKKILLAIFFCVLLLPTQAQSYEEAIQFLDQGNATEGLAILDKIIEKDPQNYDALYARAYWYMSQAEYTKALDDYTSLLQFNPNEARLYLYKGQCLQMLEEYTEAERQIFIALDIEPNNVEVLASLGNLYFELGLYGDALEFFEQALQIEPTRKELLIYKATTLFYAEKIEEALTLTKQLRNEYPQDWDLARLEAIIAFQTGNYSQTLIIFEELQKNEVPLFAEDFYYWGMTYYKQGNFSEAVFYLELPENQEDSDLLYALGRTYFQLQAYDTALEKCNLAIALIDPQDEMNAPLFYDRAVIYAKLNRIAEAEKDLQHAVYLLPEILSKQDAEGNPVEILQDISQLLNLEKRQQLIQEAQVQGWYDRSQALLDEGNPAEALSTIEKAIALQPQKAKLLVVQGIAFMFQTQYNNAIYAFNQALNLPDDSLKKDYVWYLKAIAYEELADALQAHTAIDQAIILAPSEGEYLAQKAHLFFEQEKFEEALAYINKALTLNNNLNFYIDRALFSYHLKKYTEALEDANTVLRLEPENAMGFYTRGLAYMGLGDYENAAKDFQKILENFPEDEEVRQLYNRVSSK